MFFISFVAKLSLNNPIKTCLFWISFLKYRNYILALAEDEKRHVHVGRKTQSMIIENWKYWRSNKQKGNFPWKGSHLGKLNN